MTELQPIFRLKCDLAAAAKALSLNEARYLVDIYYSLQEYCKVSQNQILALTENDEPSSVIQWFFDQTASIESQIRRALDKWTDEQPISQWAKSITGIGPVIAAGLLAHIDITKAPTVGHIWRFAGLDPTNKWEKKTRRPWNASLKTLCWKIGESFVKVCNLETDFYGKIYRQRKDQEILRNEAGDFAAQAAAMLTAKKIGKDTEAFLACAAGKLPPAHIHARAKRYAVKLFLAHYHEIAFRLHFNTDPPLPYAIPRLQHAHKIEPPIGI